MTQEQYIDAFKEKQNFENIKQIDDRVYAMDGLYFDIEDIQYDIDNGITPGKIKLFSVEGRDCGKLPSYQQWIANHYGE